MPTSPQPGGYHVQRISVDDPNLGRVEREFSISLPTRYYDRSFSTNNYSIIQYKSVKALSDKARNRLKGEF